jgi:hypothetical protein
MSNKQNDIIIEEKAEQELESKKAELYYRYERIGADLLIALQETRKEPGYTILDVSNVIKKVFKPEEITLLITFLFKNLENKV